MPKMSEEEFTVLISSIKENVCETELILSHAIDDTQTQMIAEALLLNTSLQILTLINNEIGNAGARALAETLLKNNTVRKLKLRGNQIEDEGALSLAKMLETNNTIEHLDLSNNRIGDLTAQALSKTILINTHLKELILDKNQIGDDGLKALADSLHRNLTLHSLNLESNQIGDRGAIALSEALLRNTSLRYLNLFSNKIGFLGIKSLTVVFEKLEGFSKGSIRVLTLDVSIYLIASGRLSELNQLLDIPAILKIVSNSSYDVGSELLKNAALSGQLPIVNRLLAIPEVRGIAASWNKSNEPLQAAAGKGHLAVVNRLLEIPEVLDATSNSWIVRTLCAAVVSGNLFVVNRLLEIKSIYEQAGSDGTAGFNARATALYAAAGAGFLPIVIRLLEIPHVLSNISCDRNAVLRVASRNGHIFIVDHLLQYPEVISTIANKAEKVFNGYSYIGNLWTDIPDHLALREACAHQHPNIAFYILRAYQKAKITFPKVQIANFDSLNSFFKNYYSQYKKNLVVLESHLPESIISIIDQYGDSMLNKTDLEAATSVSPVSPFLKFSASHTTAELMPDPYIKEPALLFSDPNKLQSSSETLTKITL